MFLKKHKSSTDPAMRSLVQKAARRGHANTVDIVARRLFEAGDKTWLRSRAVVITFEECWPLAHELNLAKGPESKIEALLKVTRSSKQKDAIGLGALAYSYHEGDRSTLEGLDDATPVRVVAEALSRPAAFFEWVLSKQLDVDQRGVITAAKAYLAAATWGWDKTCILAGAYLAATQQLPLIRDVPLISRGEFPYWVALDKHTHQGKSVLHKMAATLAVPYRKLIWASFYFESAQVNELEPSPWWEFERTWRLRKADMTPDSAAALWEKVRSEFTKEIFEDALKLKQTVESSNAGQDELFGNVV